jgi:hypothetical protein
MFLHTALRDCGGWEVPDPGMIDVRCLGCTPTTQLNTRLRSTADPLIARRSTALESMVDRSHLEAAIGRKIRPLARSG